MQVLPNLPGCPACSQPPKNQGKGNKAGEEPPVPEKPESTAPFKKAKDPHLAPNTPQLPGSTSSIPGRTRSPSPRLFMHIYHETLK